MYIRTEKTKLQDNVILKSTTRVHVRAHTHTQINLQSKRPGRIHTKYLYWLPLENKNKSGCGKWGGIFTSCFRQFYNAWFFSQQKCIPSAIKRITIITMTSKHKTADQRPQEDCCRMMNCRINSVEGPLWGEVGITKWILLGTIIAQADSGGDAIIESKEKIRNLLPYAIDPKTSLSPQPGWKSPPLG